MSPQSHSIVFITPYYTSFRLRDGRSIHTVTALLLQLVQTASHDVALQGRDFFKKRREVNVQTATASDKVKTKSMLDVDEQVGLLVYFSHWADNDSSNSSFRNVRSI